MAKVDVLLPFWGDVELFKKAVMSVVSQTEEDWQLLVFDDCYPSDQPRMFVQSLEDKRIKYYRHEKNIGVTANFNYALQKATADYCVMMGCDDIMLPTYLTTALQDIDTADFYQPGVDVIDANGKSYLPIGDKVKRLLRLRKKGIYTGERLASSLCTGNWLYFPSILWRTDVIKQYGFDKRYKVAQDVMLELSIIKDGKSLSLSNEITFQYRRFASSVSSAEKNKGGVRFNEEAAVYNHFAREFSAIKWRKAAFAAKVRITSRLNEIIS